MSVSPKLSQLTPVGLAYRNFDETQKFQRGEAYDQQYGFELFRLALETPHEEKSQEVWALLVKQYTDSASRWAIKHQLFAFTGEEAGYFAHIALTNMWIYFAEDKGDFSRFPDLKRVLSFLMMCVNNAIVDYYRKHVARTDPVDIAERPIREAQPRYSPPELAELWRAVYQAANTQQEHLFIHAYFELLLPRREIARIFPQFANVDEVKRVMDTLLKRLRRNEQLKQFLEVYQWN